MHVVYQKYGSESFQNSENFKIFTLSGMREGAMRSVLHALPTRIRRVYTLRSFIVPKMVLPLHIAAHSMQVDASKNRFFGTFIDWFLAVSSIHRTDTQDVRHKNYGEVSKPNSEQRLSGIQVQILSKGSLTLLLPEVSRNKQNSISHHIDLHARHPWDA